MKRIRHLGLAAIAALALTAVVGTASASASGFVADNDPFFADLTGTATGEHTLTFSGLTRSCSEVNFQGEMEEASESVSPTLNEPLCSGSPLKSNGCKFIFHPGAEKSPGVFDGSIEIGPAGCGPMTLFVKAFGCTASFYPQTGLAATFENKGTGNEASVTIKAQATKIKYSLTNPCGDEKVLEGGTYTGSWTVKAVRTGAPVGLAVASKLPIAIGLGTEANQLEALHYPVAINGTSNSSAWTLLGGNMKCNTSQFASEAAKASASLPVTPTYSDCFLFGFSGAVSTNGCQYVVNFSGTMDLTCPAGQSLEFRAWLTKAAREEGKTPACIVKFAEQTGLSSLSFGGVEYHALSLSAALTGIKYTQIRNSFLCPSGTSGTNGTYTDKTVLYGSQP